MASVTDQFHHPLSIGFRKLESAPIQSQPANLATQIGTGFGFHRDAAPNSTPRGGGYVNRQQVPHRNDVFPQPLPHGTVQARQFQPNRAINGHANSHTQTSLPPSARSNGNAYATPNFTPYNGLTSQQQRLPHQDLNLLHPISRLQHGETLNHSLQQGNGQEDTSVHFGALKRIPNPPDLEKWRERLFNVDDTIRLTEEEFQTYFPHIDNVYSHRSTQRYKRKPFVSHYWDCRLKGRPPGTPKSKDPNKKKRRRTARERDLCDVKIKITEHFPSAAADALANGDLGARIETTSGVDGPGTMLFALAAPSAPAPAPPHSNIEPFGVLAPPHSGHPGASHGKYYLIQRVNGANSSDKTNTDKGTPTSRHRHTLRESDNVKKNSVQRWLLKEEKASKNKAATTTHSNQSQSQSQLQSTSTPTLRQPALPTPPLSHASTTRKRHASPTDLTFFANSFCPFAQRVWIALEVKQMPYRFVEITPPYMAGFVSGAAAAAAGFVSDAFPRPGRGPGSNDDVMIPAELLEVNPNGIVPCFRHGNWGCWESGVLMEYLEDLSIGHSLLPLGDPQLRAHCRLWADHINRKILPPFYALLLTPGPSDPSQPAPPLHSTLTATLQTAITALVNASHVTGPFFLGPHISFVDVAFAPWIIRLSRVLKYYRGWPDPEVGSRWAAWVAAVESDERVRNTVSDDGEYRGVYGGVAGDVWGRSVVENRRAIAEIGYAKKVVREEGFGLGGDVLGNVVVG